MPLLPVRCERCNGKQMEVALLISTTQTRIAVGAFGPGAFVWE